MFQWCPWADVLYAMDRVWWDRYLAEVEKKFSGRKISPIYINPSVQYIRFWHGCNSGQGAIHLAALWGAKKVILLGYDAQHTGGQAHCHGDHPKGLLNAGAVSDWPDQFQYTANAHPGLEIINCTRQTALTCFERRELDDEIKVAGRSK